MLDLNEIVAACESLTCDEHRGWTEGESFITRARAWLPALVEELTQAREELAAVNEVVSEFYAPSWEYMQPEIGRLRAEIERLRTESKHCLEPGFQDGNTLIAAGI